MVLVYNTDGSDKSESENVGDMFMNRFQNLLMPLLALALFFSSFSFGSGDQQQANSIKFKNSTLCDVISFNLYYTNVFFARMFPD